MSPPLLFEVTQSDVNLKVIDGKLFAYVSETLAEFKTTRFLPALKRHVKNELE